ncbi:MAG: WD40 repeat domain-containing protein [Planctomycetota bacterium]|jgi:hypothetical protein
MSPLMTDFFCDLAGHDESREWAGRVTTGSLGLPASVVKNATTVLSRLPKVTQVKGAGLVFTAHSPVTNLQGSDLRGEDLTGLDLRGANLSGADLREQTLDGCDLTGANLSNADLSGASLRKAVLSHADLSGADLSRADLCGAVLEDLQGGEPKSLWRTKLVGTVLPVGRIKLRADPAAEDEAGNELSDDVEGEAAGTALHLDRPTEEQARIATFTQSARSPVQSVTWNDRGDLLATGHQDGSVRLWDVDSGQELRRLDGHSGYVWSVSFSADGSRLASGSGDKSVRLWDVDSGQELRRLDGHSDYVRSVAFSADGSRLASGSDDKSVRLWDVDSGQELRRLHVGSTVRSVMFHQSGAYLAAGCDDGTIRLFDVRVPEQAELVATLFASQDGWVAFRPDGSYRCGGNPGGSFWHTIGLCRYEIGELDEFMPRLTISDDEPLIALG